MTTLGSAWAPVIGADDEIIAYEAHGRRIRRDFDGTWSTWWVPSVMPSGRRRRQDPVQLSRGHATAADAAASRVPVPARCLR